MGNLNADTVMMQWRMMMVPCPLSSSKGTFLLSRDIQGGSWASDGGGTWLPGNGAISAPTLPNRGPFQSFAQSN